MTDKPERRADYPPGAFLCADRHEPPALAENFRQRSSAGAGLQRTKKPAGRSVPPGRFRLAPSACAL